MYDGVPCTNDETLCCYNTEKWCPDDDNCIADNGGEKRLHKVAAIKFMSTLNRRSNIAYLLNSFFQAYPFGDQRVFSDQMTNAHSLTPFPNAIVFDWATIFVLGFGNLAALE